MNHLNDDLLYTLAVKVADEADLSPEEEKALKHITECDECYHLLSSMLAMLEVSRTIGSRAVAAGSLADLLEASDPVSAVFKLAVGVVQSLLDHVDSGAGGWSFRSAPALAGARSRGKTSGSVKKLIDSDNAKTFVAYDPDKKLLVIQVDQAECTEPPTAVLAGPDGQRTAIPFEARGDLFWAQIQGLDEGDYEIILEK